MNFIEEQHRILLKDHTTVIGEICWKDENETTLNVYHLFIHPKYTGNGYAHQLIHYLVEKVRIEHKKIHPTCPFVLGTFEHHPDMFNDIWQRYSL